MVQFDSRHKSRAGTLSRSRFFCSVIDFGDRRRGDWTCKVAALYGLCCGVHRRIEEEINSRRSLFTMAQAKPRLQAVSVKDTAVIDEENEEPVGQNPKAVFEHERIRKVKHGGQKLEKRAAKRVSGLPKKSGQGGKYTWNGPISEESLDFSPVTLDKKDPNYIDEDEVVVVPKLDILSTKPLKVSVV